MLDQPVPNPLAKNPHFYTHKVFASVGLILIGVVVAVAGVWYYMEKQSEPKIEEDNSVKVSTTSAKPATSSAAKDETADWKTYTNASIGYTIKYPSDWETESSDNKNTCTPEQVFFAPNQDQLGRCASGFGGIIGITQIPASDINTVAADYTSEYYNELKKENVKVAGKNAIKITGTGSKDTENNPYVAGTKEITYIIEYNGLTDIFYRQLPTWTDYSKEFEAMVSSFQFE